MIYNTSKEDEAKNALIKLELLISRGVIVEVKEKKKVRSISQNSYLHVIITICAIEYGCSLDEMKQLLKYWKRLYKVKGKAIIYDQTSKMNSEELTGFIEWIRTRVAQMLDIYIPTSEEYIQDQHNINMHIKKFEQYL
jgi:hypothetical protein